jgi:hypothetical protein
MNRHPLSSKGMSVVWRAVGQGERKDSRELVAHKGTTLNLHGKDAVKRPKAKHPLWRKRETLIQERIVEYTTVRATSTGPGGVGGM